MNPIARLRGLAGAFERARFPHRAAGRHATIALEREMGLELFLLPSVHNPALFRTGLLLARVVRRRVRPESRVLDMGTGSGLIGLVAARAGASEVMAVDRNPEAVRAARVNAMLNRLELTVLLGDLFTPLAPELRFTLLCFNPPFFEGEPQDDAARAFQGGLGLSVLDRFLTGARAHLSPGGQILLAGSTHGALRRMRELYRRHGFAYRTVATEERISERLLVDELSA